MQKLMGKELQKYNNLYREIDDFYHNIAAQNGLSDSAFWILYTICEQGEGCLQRDICAAVYVSKQTIHSAIRKLEKDGYLYLETGKGRDKHIYLTEKGRQTVEEKVQPVIGMENAAFASLGEKESEMLLQLTEKYMRCLRGDRSYNEHSDIRTF